MIDLRPAVLVVEDDRSVRELLETILGAEGFVVHVAADGLEGLLKLRVHQPAVMVLDLMMPDLGGLRVLDELAEEHASVGVVVVTGARDAAEEARRRLPPENVFDKPFDIDEVIARVRALAGSGLQGQP